MYPRSYRQKRQRPRSQSYPTNSSTAHHPSEEADNGYAQYCSTEDDEGDSRLEAFQLTAAFAGSSHGYPAVTEDQRKRQLELLENLNAFFGLSMEVESRETEASQNGHCDMKKNGTSADQESSANQSPVSVLQFPRCAPSQPMLLFAPQASSSSPAMVSPPSPGNAISSSSCNSSPALTPLTRRKSALKRSDSSCMSLSSRSVSFANLEIREYQVTLSDHPACSIGPPVQLGWDYDAASVMSLEDYENHRQRDSAGPPVLSYYDRKRLLAACRSTSKQDIRVTLREVERVKRERFWTDVWLPLSGLDETWEHVRDNIQNWWTTTIQTR